MNTSIILKATFFTMLFNYSTLAQYCAVRCDLTNGQTQPSLIYQLNLDIPANSFPNNYQIEPGWFMELSYLGHNGAEICNEASNQIEISPGDYQQGDHDGCIVLGPGAYQNAPIPLGFSIPNQFVITSAENGQCAQDGTYILSNDCNGSIGSINPGDPVPAAYCDFVSDNHFTLQLTDQDVYAIYDAYGNNDGNGYDEFLSALNTLLANTCSNCPVNIFSFIFSAEENSYDIVIKLYNFEITNSCSVSFSGLPGSTSSSSPVSLTGSPAGGSFSGNGVVFSAFNPSLAGAGFHDITYTYTDDTGCTASQTQSILVFTLSFNFVNYNLGFIAPKIMSSPNVPDLHFSNYTLEIIDMQGRLAYQSIITSEQSNYNFSIPPLQKGIYVITMYNEFQQTSQKMVVWE